MRSVGDRRSVVGGCAAALSLVGLSFSQPPKVSGQQPPQPAAVEALDSPKPSDLRLETQIRPWLGIAHSDIGRFPKSWREAFGFSGDGGSLVSSVFRGSPADLAGLEEGDVITHLRRQGDSERLGVPNDVDIGRFVAGCKVGDKVELTLVREGKEIVRAVALESRPDKELKTSSVKAPLNDDVGKEHGAGTENNPATIEKPKSSDVGPDEPKIPIVSVDPGVPEVTIKHGPDGPVAVVTFPTRDWGFPWEEDPEMKRFFSFVTEVASNKTSPFRAGSWARSEFSDGSVQYAIEVKGGLMRTIDPSTAKPTLCKTEFAKGYVLIDHDKSTGNCIALLVVTEDLAGRSKTNQEIGDDIPKVLEEPSGQNDRINRAVSKIANLGYIGDVFDRDRLAGVMERMDLEIAP